MIRGYLECGHPVACMYRYKIESEVRKYCMGCLIEKVGLLQIGEKDVTEEIKNNTVTTVNYNKIKNETKTKKE